MAIWLSQKNPGWNATSGRVGKLKFTPLALFRTSPSGKIKHKCTKRCNVRWPSKLPNLAPHVALCRFTTSELSTALVIAMCRSGHTSAAPPEKQRDYEQHKEYKKQQFRNARRCSSDTAKAKNRCHKRDN
jgi:hypothetical protein